MKMTRWRSLVSFAALALLIAAGNPADAQDVLPRPEPPFKGKIGRTTKDSKPDFPKEVEAPKSAPNILLIMTDDVGFGASSPFGGLVKDADGSVDLYVGPKAPAGFEKNWIPTVPGKAWFPYFRLYAPTEAHFDRTWILPDFEKVK